MKSYYLHKIWINRTNDAPNGYHWCIGYWDAIDTMFEHCLACETSVLVIGSDPIDQIDARKEIAKMSDLNLKPSIRIHITDPIQAETTHKIFAEQGFSNISIDRTVKIRIGCKKNKNSSCLQLDTVNKVKNCVVWCEENGWTIAEIAIEDQIEGDRIADGGSIADLVDWMAKHSEYTQKIQIKI